MRHRPTRTPRECHRVRGGYSSLHVSRHARAGATAAISANGCWLARRGRRRHARTVSRMPPPVRCGCQALRLRVSDGVVQSAQANVGRDARGESWKGRPGRPPRSAGAAAGAFFATADARLLCGVSACGGEQGGRVACLRPRSARWNGAHQFHLPRESRVLVHAAVPAFFPAPRAGFGPGRLGSEEPFCKGLV